MKTSLTLTALAAIVTLSAAAVRADTPAHTFFPGHGDPQNNFTLTNDATNDLQLGLSAQARGAGSPAPSGLSTNYFVLPSTSFIWNFDFIIDTNPDGAGTLHLSDLMATISVTGPGGLNGTISPLLIPDNLGDGGIPVSTLGASVATLAQNSENLSFSSLFSSPVGTGNPIGFNPSTPGTYNFTLTVDNSAGTLLATDAIAVTVVPLPSAAATGFATLGLLGAAALLRKKFRTA